MHSRRQVPIKSFDTSPSFVRLIVIASVINVQGDRRRRFHIIYCRYNNIVPAIYYTSRICMEHATSLARAPQMSASRSFYYCPDRGHALTCHHRRRASTMYLFFLRLWVWISFSSAADATLHVDRLQ